MGRGVYYPHDNENGFAWAEQVIVQTSDLYDYEEDEGDMWADTFDDLWENVAACLPDSFTKTDEYRYENALVGVEIRDEDTLVHVVVGALDNEYFPSQLNLAPVHVDNTMRRIKKALRDFGLALYYRSSAWTTSKMAD